MIRSRVVSRLSPLVLAAALAACDQGPRPGPDGGTPSADDRLADWEALPEGTSVPVALGFDGPLPDSTVIRVLEAHELRPYAVYVTAAGMGSAERRERSRASLELIAAAREQAIEQLRTAVCAQQGRARAMLAEEGPADPGSAEPPRAVLSRFVRMQRSLTELELGGPLVYGVEAVGGLEEVKAVRSDPAVATFEPGWRGRIQRIDTIVVPEPPGPSEISAEIDPEIAALGDEEIRSRMAQLAEDGMGACADASGP